MRLLPRREHIDRLVSGSAGIVAASALAVSAYSAGLDATFRGTSSTTSSVRRGMVLLPGSTTELVRMTGPASMVGRQMLNDARVRIRVCYCSLYQECWMSDSSDREPTPLKACPVPPGPEFES